MFLNVKHLRSDLKILQDIAYDDVLRQKSIPDM